MSAWLAAVLGGGFIALLVGAYRWVVAVLEKRARRGALDRINAAAAARACEIEEARARAENEARQQQQASQVRADAQARAALERGREDLEAAEDELAARTGEPWFPFPRGKLPKR